MPLAITPKPTYPNVPRAPGVPPVLRQVGQAQNAVVQLAADAATALRMFQTPRWGLFTQDGNPAFATQSGGIGAAVLSALGSGGQMSVAGVEYRNDTRLTTAPQEQGSFLSYNKVSNPLNGRVSYIVGGTEAERGQFLAQVQTMQASLTLYNLVMPEYYYRNVNVVHHDYRRSAKEGVTLFVVDIWVEEVRMTGTTAYSNTQTPAGADAANGGTVQPQQPTPAQQLAAGTAPL